MVRPPCFSALVCGVGFSDLENDLLLFTASSVSFSNFYISLAPSLLPIFLIALLQAAMAAIILSA